MKTIIFAGGCFWGVEAYFQRIKGVLYTEVGYANSIQEKPSYEQVCSGATKATEAVKIQYDEKVVSLQTLITQFFSIIDPYSLNRQGNDIGTQYRTGIYSLDDESLAYAKQWLKDFEARSQKKSMVEILHQENFYSAEEFHQHYLDKNPSGYCHIDIYTLPQELTK